MRDVVSTLIQCQFALWVWSVKLLELPFLWWPYFFSKCTSGYEI